MQEVVANKIAAKIQKGNLNAAQAVARLIEEGTMSTDFIAPLGVELSRKGSSPIMTFEANGSVKMILPNGRFDLHKNAVNQLGEKLAIPTKYLNTLAGGEHWQKELAAHVMNVHSSFTDRSRVLVRAVGRQVRGVLSDSYNRLNAQDIITAFLTEAQRQGGQLADGFMDDTRIYIEVLMPKPIEINLPKNGTVYIAFGARFSTSDYGDSSVQMRTFFMNGVCLNGATRESILKQVHAGGKLPDNLQLSERTYKLATQTLCSTIKDVTSQIFSRDNLQRKVREIELAGAYDVDLSRELSNLQKNGNLLKSEADSITQLFMRNREDDGLTGENTLWKLVQGITAQARELEPRRSRELHDLAGSLLDRVN